MSPVTLILVLQLHSTGTHNPEPRSKNGPEMEPWAPCASRSCEFGKLCISHNGVPAAETSTQLESVSASHRRAAASLLDQSKLHGGSIAEQTNTSQVFSRGCMHCLHPSTHLDSACASHRRAAASLLDQSELHGGSVAEHTHCTCMCLVAAACTVSTRARTFSPPPPRTVEQPHACSTRQSFIAAPLQIEHIAGAWSRLRRYVLST